MTSAFSWQNSVSLCPASFCILRPKLACSYRYLLTSYFCIPMMKRIYIYIYIFLMLVLEGLVGLHKTVQLQLLQHYWPGHRLGLQ